MERGSKITRNIEWKQEAAVLKQTKTFPEQQFTEKRWLK